MWCQRRDVSEFAGYADAAKQQGEEEHARGGRAEIEHASGPSGVIGKQDRSSAAMGARLETVNVRKGLPTQ